MKLTTIFSALTACSHAMFIPTPEGEGSLQSRADHPGSEVGTVVPDRYIVVLKTGQAESDYKALGEWFVKQVSGSQIEGGLLANASGKMTFFNVLNFMGYTGYLPPTLLDTVKKNPLVDFVEEDKICKITKFARQKKAPWGIARISQRANKKIPSYDYDNQAGKGVTAYVVDTGIKVDHPDFELRARWGINVANPGRYVDDSGHGTHVAGTLAGKTYGVAKKAELVAVAVFDQVGEGHIADMVKGIEFSVREHEADVREKTKGYKGAILNLSFGGVVSAALDRAANAAMDAGLHVAIAAGNNNEDACNVSPARASDPITVGATDIDDIRGNYSNYGKCVDVQAPGTNILSAGVKLLTAVLTGTSHACPHVAGILATFVSLQPGIDSEFQVAPVTPKDLKRKFLKFSTRGVVKGLDKDTVNKFAYNGAGLSLKDLWIL